MKYRRIEMKNVITLVALATLLFVAPAYADPVVETPSDRVWTHTVRVEAGDPDSAPAKSVSFTRVDTGEQLICVNTPAPGDFTLFTTLPVTVPIPDAGLVGRLHGWKLSDCNGIESSEPLNHPVFDLGIVIPILLP